MASLFYLSIIRCTYHNENEKRKSVSLIKYTLYNSDAIKQQEKLKGFCQHCLVWKGKLIVQAAF